MTLATIQEYVNGPWRWAILDDDGYVVARSRVLYKREGMARNALRDMVDVATSLKASDKIESHPSVQLDLFQNLRVGGGKRMGGQQEVACAG